MLRVGPYRCEANPVDLVRQDTIFVLPRAINTRMSGFGSASTGTQYSGSIFPGPLVLWVVGDRLLMQPFNCRRRVGKGPAYHAADRRQKRMRVS